MFSFMKAVTFGLFHQTQKGETALHLACNEGHYDVVRLLLQAPALLNIVDEVLMQNQIVLVLLVQDSNLPLCVTGW